MAREMLVNVSEGEECRIAVVDDGVLEELYIERANVASTVGNIYKGRIVNIEAGIQAAFVDFGQPKSGFLHISDLHPRYFPEGQDKEEEKIGRRQSVTQRPLIQKCLKKGMEIVVQVIKEGINTKGPTLSTYISLPGRYAVLMPWMNQVGVSQKIEDEAERKRLRELASTLKLPKQSGLIIRTAAQMATKRELQNDVSYLSRLWNAILKRSETEKAPALIYQESDLVIRTVRDIFDSRISKIYCDSEAITQKIKDFLGIVQPRMCNRVVYYDGKVPLFSRFRIEQEIEKIQSPYVPLKSGGSLVIEQTEALVAIDVNSGKYRKQDNAEQTALKINLEAAKEIVRQLKLRDLGGLIVCDFIDMRDGKNRREVERVFREALKSDRARSRALKMSQFGLIELTRQRIRPSLQLSTYQKCPHCQGRGMVKSYESQAIELIRLLQTAAARKEIQKIELRVQPEVADFLQNQKRSVLVRLESENEKEIAVHADWKADGQTPKIICYDARGNEVKI
ncbi:MAG TPA: Rne/Rng family ribonuclease [Anaerohalosphaeraceae bacterium]|nr:Rne/Rng family ribonuclease [Anaerohalosphaeraceae bacterium]HOL87926.1 Rne/Rng family ribonuclease [Anaerohalosphaeraceae bacterium]HPP55425.1 Rne/Rng family ribonuclease [Anaerohalosphaeraceae bacterium]